MSKPSPLPQRLVGVSTKMYFDIPKTTTYLTTLLSDPPTPTSKTTIFFIPSFPTLPTCATALDEKKAQHILLGAQDSHWEDTGAYTGEVSPLMLSQLGCRIVELGHAERRRPPFNETDEITGMKAKAVSRNNMIPLVCIGEKTKSSILSEGVGFGVRDCTPQISAVLDAVPGDKPVVFAYEPIWAIGASEPAGADHVCAVVRRLKEVVGGRVGRSGDVRFLYGGSAGPGTWERLKGDLDGLFLGRFAHDVGNFRRTIEEVDA